MRTVVRVGTGVGVVDRISLLHNRAGQPRNKELGVCSRRPYCSWALHGEGAKLSVSSQHKLTSGPVTVSDYMCAHVRGKWSRVIDAV